MARDVFVLDSSYYPFRFKSFKVTKEDANGNPIETTFYNKITFEDELFMWIQTFNEDDKLTSWLVKNL